MAPWVHADPVRGWFDACFLATRPERAMPDAGKQEAAAANAQTPANAEAQQAELQMAPSQPPMTLPQQQRALLQLK